MYQKPNSLWAGKCVRYRGAENGIPRKPPLEGLFLKRLVRAVKGELWPVPPQGFPTAGAGAVLTACGQEAGALRPRDGWDEEPSAFGRGDVGRTELSKPWRLIESESS